MIFIIHQKCLKAVFDSQQYELGFVVGKECLHHIHRPFIHEIHAMAVTDLQKYCTKRMAQSYNQ